MPFTIYYKQAILCFAISAFCFCASESAKDNTPAQDDTPAQDNTPAQSNKCTVADINFIYFANREMYENNSDNDNNNNNNNNNSDSDNVAVRCVVEARYEDGIVARLAEFSIATELITFRATFYTNGKFATKTYFTEGVRDEKLYYKGGLLTAFILYEEDGETKKREVTLYDHKDAIKTIIFHRELRLLGLPIYPTCYEDDGETEEECSYAKHGCSAISTTCI